MLESKNKVCEWAQVPHIEVWTTSCEFEWLLNQGTPASNGMNYCPKCGKLLVEKQTEIEESDDE